MSDSDQPKRKLTTILAADVVGYSSLMAEDEDGTHKALKRCRDLFFRYIAQHEGRVFNMAGDSVLAEFGSAVEAVRCAITIQESLLALNEDPGLKPKMVFRIGINVGDVLVDGDDLFGDGVNIAARMESIAEPGGICISGSVYELVHNKLSFAFVDLGRQQVKNIAAPVAAFSLQPSAGISVQHDHEKSKPGISGHPGSPGKKRGYLRILGLVVLCLVVGVVLLKGVQKAIQVKKRAQSQEQVLLKPLDLNGARIYGLRSNPVHPEERFQLLLNMDGSISMRLTYDQGEKRKTGGRWWVNDLGFLCIKFKWFKSNQKFCRKPVENNGKIMLLGGKKQSPAWELELVK